MLPIRLLTLYDAHSDKDNYEANSNWLGVLGYRHPLCDGLRFGILTSAVH
jgi:hypothetical protein